MFMEYPVIVEQKNGTWRAVIPALSDLSAEGASRDEAMKNAQRTAEDYLSKVEVTTIKVALPREQTLRAGSPQALLKEIEAFAGDEEALREHFEEIVRGREQQREEAQLQRDGHGVDMSPYAREKCLGR
jgi:predicted RNase H-like HicB family nuclease